MTNNDSINSLKNNSKEIIFNKVVCDKLYANSELSYKAILEKYPLLYSNVKCGFNPPVGWLKLIDNLSKELEEINVSLIKRNEKPIVCFQVKEKWAELRFYVSEIPKEIEEEVYSIIGKYISISRETCEETGGKGFHCLCGHWFHVLSEESMNIIGGKKTERMF